MHERERNARGLSRGLRLSLLMVFPLLCLIVVFYEFIYLQNYNSTNYIETRDSIRLRAIEPVTTTTTTTAYIQDPYVEPSTTAAIEEQNEAIEEQYEVPMTEKVKKAPKKPFVPINRTIMVLIANYRDSNRCAETLESLFTTAVQPSLIHVSIYDQIYNDRREISCHEKFCELVGENNCRRDQIQSRMINAAYATGPTAARYETEKGITDEDFCLAIDSHLVFVPEWDEKLLNQYVMTDNPKAIITVYPKATDYFMSGQVNQNLQLMCKSRIETEDADAMIQYGAPIWINRSENPKPRLMSQLAGGFNFGTCQQLLEVRNDPYTPYLFHGEEYSRAARLWTHGYDMYVPSEDIVFHWYEKRNVVWERDWPERYKKQQAAKRRIRYNLGLPVTAEDFDRTDLELFGLGTKRTMEQFIKFSGIDPLAPFISKDAEQFRNCGILEYVPYDDDD